MKKILFTFLTIFIFMDTVEANEFQEEVIEGPNVETEYRYRFYKEEKEGEYIRIGKDNNYMYEDKTDIIYSDYSEYQTSCKSDEGYETEYKTKYVYREILPVQYIKITNNSEEDLTVANIEPLENNNLLGYEIYKCINCMDRIIAPYGQIIIELEKEVRFKDLEFILEFFDLGNKINYELIYSNDNLFSTTSLVALTKSQSAVSNYLYSDFRLFNNYTKDYIGYDIEKDELMYIVSEEKVCRTREIKSYHYNIIKKYYDDNYYKDIEELTNLTEEEKLEYKKDFEDYKIFYRYKEDNNLKLVKTGVTKKKPNYNYLVIYILTLSLIALILIKHIKTMSNENKD